MPHLIELSWAPSLSSSGSMSISSSSRGRDDPHWDVFSHHHVTFWIWATLYFTTPFLVSGPGWLTGALLLCRLLRSFASAGLLGGWLGSLVLALVQGLVIFLAPGLVAPFWPWSVTPLSCRVIGAIFCLGCAGLVVFTDPRWSTLKLVLQVE